MCGEGTGTTKGERRDKQGLNISGGESLDDGPLVLEEDDDEEEEEDEED